MSVTAGSSLLLLVVSKYKRSFKQSRLLTVQAPAAKRGSKAAKASDDGDAADGDAAAAGAEGAPEAQPVGKGKAKGKAAKAAPGHVKVGAKSGVKTHFRQSACACCWRQGLRACMTSEDVFVLGREAEGVRHSVDYPPLCAQVGPSSGGRSCAPTTMTMETRWGAA